MTEEEFKAQYIAIFIATRAAMKYDNACATNQHESLEAHHDIEDAVHLSGYAWKAYQEHKDD